MSPSHADLKGRRQCPQRLGQTALLAVSGWGTAPLAQAATVPDVWLTHRDGQRVRLRSDVWRDRVALVNFVFTDCSSFCGVQSAMLAELQTRLGARLGKEVVLVSLTLDPLTDDPRRLHTYSSAFNPGPHWWWLTGDAPQVFKALDALGADRGDPSEHGPLWLVGPAHAQRRLVGFPTLAQIESAVGAAVKGVQR